MTGPALAIVIGRAGSKGLKGKNMLPVAGKPCAQWTIEAALASKSISRVCVSSDDSSMLDLARSLGAIALERPADLAGDRATVDSAARHAASSLGDLATAPLSLLVILYANVPVRPPGLIDRAVNLLTTASADSVQSYAPVGKYHPWWTARINEQGAVTPWEGQILNHGVFRRQDLPPAFIPDGGVIAVTRRSLMLEIPAVPPGPHAFFGVERRGIVNAEGDVVDIDSRVDLLVADAILRERSSLIGSGAA